MKNKKIKVNNRLEVTKYKYNGEKVLLLKNSKSGEEFTIRESSFKQAFFKVFVK
jgi:hypothetical protein